MQLYPTILSRAAVALIVSCAVAGKAAQPASQLSVSWTNNMLSISGKGIPGGPVKVWYLEAFCRSGSTKRPWDQTTIPQKTKLVSADPQGKSLRLHTSVQPKIEVEHELRVEENAIDLQVTLQNTGTEFVDVDWFQPCIRVDRFTGRGQSNYISKCFIYTERGLATLDQTRRTEEALYRGGQVYVPTGVNLADVNPRPISPDRPVNGLIGCFSADDQWLLASAWDQTQELFQGVIVCVHNDPRVGGLKAGETKKLHGKIYLMHNDPAELLRRYNADFPKP